MAASPQLSALMSWLPGIQETQLINQPVHCVPPLCACSPFPVRPLLLHPPCAPRVASTFSQLVALLPLLSPPPHPAPESVSLCDWTMVYSTQVHSRNLSAFYSKAKLIGPTLMLLQTQVRRSGEETALGPSASPVFGFYCSKSMAPTSKRAPNWVGSLDSFLFQVRSGSGGGARGD